uniref:CCHC-type domain-containing protein n=1 Tax=Aegilops tauschii subsp. strangulata TaxID=200361 RepID=A0A453LTA4_AEGTS
VGANLDPTPSSPTSAPAAATLAPSATPPLARSPAAMLPPPPPSLPVGFKPVVVPPPSPPSFPSDLDRDLLLPTPTTTPDCPAPAPATATPTPPMPAAAGGCPAPATAVAAADNPMVAPSLLQPAASRSSRPSSSSSLPSEPAPVDPLAPSFAAAALVAAALACCRSDPAIGGRKARSQEGLDPFASPPAGRPYLPAGQPPALTAPAPRDAAGGDRSVPPVRSGWGDWRGCFHRDEATTVLECELGGWQTVSKGRRSPPPTVFCRPSTTVRRSPPAWLRNRCFRCLCRGHRAHSCRDPIRCTDCLRSGHIARFCRAKKPVHQASLLQCHARSPASTGDVSMIDVQFRSVSAEHVGLVEETKMLRTELHDCLARVNSVLGRAEAALDKLEVVPDVSSLPELQIGVVPDVSLLPEIQVGSVDGEAGMYGDLSPHATACRLPLPVVPVASRSEVIVEVVALVLQIMPELQKLCGETTSPISMVLPEEMGSLRGDLAMPTATSSSSLEPSQALAFVDLGGLVVVAALSAELVGPVASVGAEVDEVGALAPVSEAPEPVRSSIFDHDAMWARIDEVVYAKKLGRLLTGLDAACPGSAKTIACLLVEEVSSGKRRR